MNCYVAALEEQSLVIMLKNLRPDVLIIGCTPDSIRSISEQLTGERYVSYCCHDREEAIAKSRQISPACVIVDLQNKCTACLEAAHLFRELLTPDQPLIAIIQDTDDDEVVQSAFSAGFDDVMELYKHPKSHLFAHRVRRLIENTTRRLQERDQQQDLSDAIREVMTKMTNALHFDEILECILDNIGRVVDHDAASISIIEGGVLRNRYLRGYSAETTQQLSSLEFRVIDAPVTREGITSGKTQIINDTANDPRWIRLVVMREAVNGRSVLCVPVKTHGQVIGFIYLDKFDIDGFTQKDAQRMDVFADQAAIALTNAALYDTIDHNATRTRQLQQATALLLNTELLTASSIEDACAKIAETVVSSFQAVDCGVMLVDWDTRVIARVARAGEFEVKAAAELTVDSRGLVPESVRTREVVYAPDVLSDNRYANNEWRTRSELVIPLVASNLAIGVLDLQSSQLNGFSEQDIKTLRVFADYAAAVLENLRLIHDIRVAERADAILNYSSEAILVVHPQKGIQQINPGCSLLFMRTLDEIEGQPLLVLADESAHALLSDALNQVFLTGVNNRVTIDALRGDDETFPADLTLSPMFAPNGREIIGVVCGVRDITVHKQLEEDLQSAVEHQRELLELKTLFVRHASHELRTPLSVISTSVDLLLMAGERKSPADRAERLKLIQRQVAQLKNILDELLDLNTYQNLDRDQLRIVEFDLEEMCHEAIAQTRMSMGEHVHEYFVENLGTHAFIQGDRDRIGLALKQLLTNAATFSDQGTRIDVKLNGYDNIFEIQITDRGIGIPKQEQKRIFEPFYRVRTDLHERYSSRTMGAGLGLTIAYQVITLHGGWIQIESEEHMGTTVILFLPAMQPIMSS